MNKEPHTMQVADAATASRAPENTPAMVKKIGKTTYKVHWNRKERFIFPREESTVKDMQSV